MSNQKQKLELLEEEWLNAQSDFLANGSFVSSNPEIKSQIELIESMPEDGEKIEKYRELLDQWRTIIK